MTLPAVFLGRDAVDAGVLSQQQLRGPRVRRLFNGVYCPFPTPVDHTLLCRAAALIGQGQLVLTGRSAATIRGVALADAHDPVEVLTLGSARVHRRPGLDVRRARIDAAHHGPWREIRIATPLRTAFDVISRRPIADAVADLDQLLRAGAVERAALQRFLSQHHDDGVVHARAVLGLADGRAESRPESAVRVLLALGGVVAEPQHKIIGNDGSVVARVDLAIVEIRLAIEYDGRWHAERSAFTRDRERLNAIHGAGWEVLTVTAEMLRTRHRVLDLVTAATARRRRELNAS